jgi:hypothetical protein
MPLPADEELHYTKQSRRTKPALPSRKRTGTEPQANAPTRPKASVPRNSSLVSPRPGSKSAKVVALLNRVHGASLKELQKATGWQAHSIRGFLSGTVAGKMGLKVSSSTAESGERRYVVKP